MIIRIASSLFAVCFLGLAGCATPSPSDPTEAELSAVADTVLALDTALHRDFDSTNCDAALSLVGNREPVLVGGGMVYRTLAEFQSLCRVIVADRSKAELDLADIAVHALSRNAAYVVREGTYTEYNKAGEVGNSYYIIFTTIWHHQDGQWTMAHLHESWRDPDADAS